MKLVEIKELHAFEVRTRMPSLVPKQCLNRFHHPHHAVGF
jgi:hypothetical protein